MKFTELLIAVGIAVAGGVVAWNYCGPAQGWGGSGMKNVLPGCVSVAGTFMAALLAMVLYVCQNLQNPSFFNLAKRGRMAELMILFGAAAALWGGFLISSFALQTYEFPQDNFRRSLRIWHSIWTGTGLAATLLCFFLFAFLLKTAMHDSKKLSKQ